MFKGRLRCTAVCTVLDTAASGARTAVATGTATVPPANDQLALHDSSRYRDGPPPAVPTLPLAAATAALSAPPNISAGRYRI